MSDDSEAKLSAAARLALPGEEHRALQGLIGSFTARMELVGAPDADPITAQIDCQRKWLFEGRYLQEELSGSFNGVDYKRTGVLTFHRLLRRYQFFTFDNLDTGYMPYESLDIPEGDFRPRLNMYGSFIYAGAGKDVVGQLYRTHYAIQLPSAESPDRHSAEMWFAPPAQAAFRFCKFDFEMAY